MTRSCTRAAVPSHLTHERLWEYPLLAVPGLAELVEAGSVADGQRMPEQTMQYVVSGIGHLESRPDGICDYRDLSRFDSQHSLMRKINLNKHGKTRLQELQESV